MDSIWAILFLGFGLVLYFLPTIVASKRGHPPQNAIGLLNLFLGWTFIGWIIAVIWCATATREQIRANG